MPEKYVHGMPLLMMWAKEIKGAIVDKEMVRSLAVAFVLGAVLLYGTVQTLGARIDNIVVLEKERHLHIDRDMDQIKSQINDMHQLLFDPHPH